jgi:hypothetical protein
MASFMASLLVGYDTMRARGNANIKGKPVSSDPSTPLLVHNTCRTLRLGAAIPLDILKRVISVGVADRRALESRLRHRVLGWIGEIRFLTTIQITTQQSAFGQRNGRFAG